MQENTYLIGGKTLKLLTISILGSLAFSSSKAADLPAGGTVKFGSGTINQPTNQQMQINQSSDKLAIDWQSFNIAEGNKVNFQQPSSNAIALNRVVGTEGSKVMGQLNANGRVFLVNPNGVLFGSNAQVNVGGLVASTQDLPTANFALGKYNFSGGNSPASVINQGTITAQDGGTVVLLGGQVSNQGNIQANLGSVKLAAGKATTLDFAGDGLVNIQVTGAAANALAENSGFIQADGGQVVMSAAYANSNVLQTVVNNTGTIQAQTLSSKAGKIVLSGGQQGLVNVDGLLDTSAAELGNGGTVDTSGRTVNVNSSTVVDTRGMGGQTGTWSVTADKLDVNDSTSSNKVSARAVSNNLRTSNIELFSNNSDLTVGNDISWTSANQLVLATQDSLVLNANLKATGKNAKLAFIEGGDYLLAKGKNVTLSGQGASFNNNGQNYTVIQTLNQLQAMENNLAGYYVLGNTIDASSTAQVTGFRPVGYDDVHAFTGIFSGLGNTINQLTLKQQNVTYGYMGLFGYSKGELRNVGLVNANIAYGNGYSNYVGSLAGRQSGGSVHDIYAENVNISRTVGGTVGDAIGGLIGQVAGTEINNTYATGNISKGYRVGGLVGYATDSSITNAYADSSVAGDAASSSLVGGLVGEAYKSTILHSYALGDAAGEWVGGLVGRAQNSFITDSHATGNVTGSSAGGLVGTTYGSTITGSYATGDVTGWWNAGGLIGSIYTRAIITDSYATGNVNVTREDDSAAGGLVGYDYNSTITNSYALGNVVGALRTGGLVGDANYSTITHTYATGDVTGLLNVGGLVGYATAPTISYSHASGDVYARGDVTGERDSAAGGLVGHDYNSTITDSYATGDVTGSLAGGLAGFTLYSTIIGSHATGDVTGWARAGGGLVGEAYNSTIFDSYATGHVTGGLWGSSGGLVGKANYSAIENSYATGDVKGYWWSVGELIGSNDGSYAANSYGYGVVYYEY